MEWALVVQSETLEIEIGISVVEIRQAAEIISPGTPSGENVLAIDECVDVAAELHVVFTEGVGEIVLNLELAIVIVGGEIEPLPKFSDTGNEDFRSAAKDRVPFPGFAFDTGADFVHLTPENSGQSKDAADALVDEILRVKNRVKGLRLSVSASETPCVIPRTEASDTEVIRSAELVVVVP